MGGARWAWLADVTSWSDAVGSRRCALIVLLALGGASASVAAEPPAWPQFRGPGGSGVAPTALDRLPGSARTGT
jgi:hypothetical protein